MLMVVGLATAVGQNNKNKQETPLVPPPELVTVDEKGRLVPKSATRDNTPTNPVPDQDWLEGWRDRVDLVLRTSLTQKFSFNTHFENEKKGLGQAMARALAGDPLGRAKLSEKDAQADTWHQRTAGIDYYACFVIKHQPRKFFYFAPLLPSEYLQQMRDGAKAWTEVDPNRRKSDVFTGKKSGFDPEAVNSWVDTRTTDNLSMMRFTAVYLMAEESGSEDVRQAYKKRIARFAAALFRAGNGEWDSENYLGHTITPVFNIHDFARDPEVRTMGKAMLDWWLTATAVKYYRGGAVGPNCRDYNHVQPFGGSLPEMGWMFFGAPKNPHDFEYDVVHAATSGYVPPPAVVNLGTKNFQLPVELLNSKPSYHEPQAGDFWKPAAYHEFLYYGKRFVLGSLAEGFGPEKSSVNGFKIAFEDEQRAVADIRLAPTNQPEYVGSDQHKEKVMHGPTRAAQNRDAALILVKGSASPWLMTYPDTVRIKVEDGITFLEGDKVWAAFHPISAEPLRPDADATRRTKQRERTSRKTVEVVDPETGKKERKRQDVTETVPFHADHSALTGLGGGGAYSGYAVEIGEGPEYKSFDDFRKAVKERSRLDTARIADGEVEFVTASGRRLKVKYADDLKDYQVWRDGQLHDWQEHGSYVYRETGKGEDGLIFQRRGEAGGTLWVNAGGRKFRGTLSQDGLKYEFTND